MPEYKVSVKWTDQTHHCIVLCTEENLYDFKAKVFSLTNVLPDRQKLIYSGQILDDKMWKDMEFKDGMTFRMIGSTGDLPKFPISTTSVVLPRTKMGKIVKWKSGLINQSGGGIKNLGNTCYFNSAIQLLRAARGFVREITAPGFIPPPPPPQQEESKDASIPLITGISSLIRLAERGMDTTMRVSYTFPVFLQRFPQFGGHSPGGPYKQQDARTWTHISSF
ncbi:hypothetical protein ACOME3_010286 [Neoechinorhynchus agilis]